MSTALHFFKQLYSRARRYLHAGETRRAIAVLRRLAAYPDAPTALVGHAHLAIGLAWFRRRCVRRARREFLQALQILGPSPRLHHLLGRTFHRDEPCNVDQASFHYQESLRLKPLQPRCLADAGLLALSVGGTDIGLRLLRNAADLAPADISVLRRVVRGYLLAGFPDEANRVVRAALFLRPRCPQLRNLWAQLQIVRLRREKELALLAAGRPDEPVLLPFIRVVSERTDHLDDNLRLDHAETLPGPHLTRFRARRTRRRAP
ncbi:MAG: hypothetical protein U0840_17240 [Gemmataceae bacterium]